jgi:hypothetical protein
VCIDKDGKGYLFHAASDILYNIPSIPSKTQKILWDGIDSNLFVAVEEDCLYTYVIERNTVDGF